MNTQAIREFCDAWDAGKEIEVQPAWHEKMTPFRVSKSTHPSYEPNFAHDMHTVVEPPKLTVEVGRWYERPCGDGVIAGMALAIGDGHCRVLVWSLSLDGPATAVWHTDNLANEVPCPDWAKAWYRKPGKVETESRWIHPRSTLSPCLSRQPGHDRYIKATPEVLAALGEETP